MARRLEDDELEDEAGLVWLLSSLDSRKGQASRLCLSDRIELESLKIIRLAVFIESLLHDPPPSVLS